MTCTHSVSKGNPVNIPEPGCGPSVSAISFDVSEVALHGAVTLVLSEVVFKGCSTGGNAKPTFGMLAVTPGRDLFSS